MKATLVTLEGHPLAGAVRFLSEQRGDKVRFETQVYDHPANIADWFAMKSPGDSVEARTWESVVQRMIDESGGVASNGIEHREEDLNDEKTDLIEGWLKDLVQERRRSESSG